MDRNLFNEDISIVISGEAGQGVKSLEKILATVAKNSGYNIFTTEEYMSRIRGGVNSTEIRVSSNRIKAYVNKIDILIPLTKDTTPHLSKRITPDTLVIGEKKDNPHFENLIDVHFTEIAKEIGGKIYSNTVAVGVVAGILNLEKEEVKQTIKKRFQEKGDQVVQNNIEALTRGYEVAEKVSGNKLLAEIKERKITPDNKIKDEPMTNGGEAVALGALAGGCNFISSYPMSPSTSVLVNLAKYSRKIDIIVEQAEDEISAVNMMIGAWYAGARAMITTSGGGFALMCEGLSLAGIMESPAVFHLAQRPGPATGLPTRTEQGDLTFALYAGHGDFPRIILAPRSPRQAFSITQKAFNLADKYQVPVIIMTDQFLLESFYNIEERLSTKGMKIERHIVQTDEDYKRYRFTDNGISPRGIPGYGKGLVKQDSDEHTEEGLITEDLDNVRIPMVDKRMKKLDVISEDMIEPELIGSKEYKTLLVGWGSTYHSVVEAIRLLKRDDLAFLHCSWVYPLPNSVKDYLNKAEKVIAIENNHGGQFAKLIKQETGKEADDLIVKYNGLSFAVEEVYDEISKRI
jgi:2-oxoglutarate/2-oxoacid ferredoxin oxidoreductase subunit alpha